MRNTVLRDSKAIKVYIGRTGSPELCRTKVINFWLVKTDKERCSIIWDSGITTTRLKLRRNSRKRTYNKRGVEHKARWKKKKKRKEKDDVGRKDLQKKKKDEVKREGKSAKITRNGGYGYSRKGYYRHRRNRGSRYG